MNGHPSSCWVSKRQRRASWWGSLGLHVQGCVLHAPGIPMDSVPEAPPYHHMGHQPMEGPFWQGRDPSVPKAQRSSVLPPEQLQYTRAQVWSVHREDDIG